MNVVSESSLGSRIPTVLGTPFEGGFYAGTYRTGADTRILILPPKAQARRRRVKWGEYGKDVSGARSFFDGMANTRAMAEAGSEIAEWALGLSVNGFNDLYLASRDELEMLYRAFKPTTDKNATYWYGDNPSSIPPGYPYTEDSPTQTVVEAFREGGPEAFDPVWHWSSTQSSAFGAWGQDFASGYAGNNGKLNEASAVAVRSLILR